MTAQNNQEQIINLRRTYPDYTLLQIGEQVGVSRERVRQVLKKNGLQTRSTEATKYLIPKHLRKGNPCQRCNTPVPWVDLGAYQHANGKYYQRGGYQKYCSDECRRAPMTKYVCANCGEEKEITTAKYNVKLKRREEGLYSDAIYCSHSCKSLGYWKVAKGLKENTYGYKSNPYVLDGGNLRGQRAKRVDIQCHTCGIDFEITEALYKVRMKKNVSGHMYCSKPCFQVQHRIEAKAINIECANCKKEVILTLGEYNNRMKTSKNGNLYCSRACFWVK